MVFVGVLILALFWLLGCCGLANVVQTSLLKAQISQKSGHDEEERKPIQPKRVPIVESAAFDAYEDPLTGSKVDLESNVNVKEPPSELVIRDESLI